MWAAIKGLILLKFVFYFGNLDPSKLGKFNNKIFMTSSFLSSSIKQFQYYKMLGDNTFAQIPESKILWSPVEGSNSIGTIVNHLKGNMLSRWTDFMTSDGEKEWRNRDSEFDPHFENIISLKEAWEEGWSILFAALEPLKDDDLEKLIYIRNQGHSVVEALNRQLAHYAYHIGQIVYLGTLICGDNWQSLSIPKGTSKTYNEEKFAQEKTKAHFTDEMNLGSKD